MSAKQAKYVLCSKIITIKDCKILCDTDLIKYKLTFTHIWSSHVGKTSSMAAMWAIPVDFSDFDPKDSDFRVQPVHLIQSDLATQHTQSFYF